MLIALHAFGCSSSVDFQDEAQKVIRQLTETLEGIDNSEQLAKKALHLKRLFNRLADAMIASYQPNSEIKALSKAELLASDQLRLQLNRVCSMHSGYETIEKCQEEALHKLNKFSLKHPNF